MNHVKRTALALLLPVVEKLVEDASTADVEYIVGLENGIMRFRAGTHEVRMAGITGTCTEGYPCALRSWVCRAKQRLED